MTTEYTTPKAIVLPSTPEKKAVAVARIKNEILEGRLNPLDFYRQAKLFGDMIEELKKDADIFDCAYSERLKYGKQKPTINGSIVDLGSRTTYDYDSCGDPTWKELKEKLKAREQFLKNIPSGGVADPETGLLIEPPTAKVSEFFVVKI